MRKLNLKLKVNTHVYLINHRPANVRHAVITKIDEETCKARLHTLTFDDGTKSVMMLDLNPFCFFTLASAWNELINQADKKIQGYIRATAKARAIKKELQQRKKEALAKAKEAKA